MSTAVECAVCRGARPDCAYCTNTVLPPGQDVVSLVHRVSGDVLETAGEIALDDAYRARYQLERQLGAGACGAVWLAQDLVGRIRESTGDLAGAERELRAAIGAGYDGPDVQLRLANLLLRLGREDEATAHFQRAAITKETRGR